MVCLQGTEEAWMEPATVKRETLILSAGVVFLLDPLLLELFHFVHTPKLVGLALTRLIQTLGVLAIVLAFQKSLAPIGLSSDHLWNGLKKGTLWALGTGIITLACFFLLYVLGVSPVKMLKTRLPHETIQIIFYFITGGLIAPVAEEVFFRGVLFGFLRTWGFAFALCVSTAIFASFHVLFSGQIFPVTQIAGGLLFATSFEKEKSLWVPIIIHATGNIAIFTLSLL